MIKEFQQLWQSAENSPPDVFAFLSKYHDAKPADVVSVLLHDQKCRWQTDSPIKVENYLGRLPNLAANSDCKLKLAVGEFQVRQQGDTAPSIDEFTSRFDEISDSLRPKLQDVIFATVSNDLTVRDQYIGRYRLARLLGKGAFGIVWLGFDSELHRQVAIKVPTAERFQRPEDAEAYLVEARTVAKLDHPNIVPVHDVGRSEDGSVFVVSKFINGGTLADRITQQRPDFDQAARLIALCALGLSHAHQKGIIHRDVKPANILIEEESGTPYVADFGLAIREEDFAKQSGFAGTPAYMSPEQACGEGHRLDGRSDIFALGVVLYELLTANMPFRGSTPNELFHQIISEDPKPPHEHNESIPSELQRICLRALAKQASDRYATADDFADDLLNWNQGPGQQESELQIVPKGLRSFDVGDADFFLSLLPGPRNRDGLPESIQFWKTRIEEADPDKTFSVGLIYGPSGCGKSSLMKAGLLPRLSTEVVAVYVEATPDETETRILRDLRKQFPELPPEAGIAETFTLLRRGEGKKVVVVIDQFEQWLHAHRAEPGAELVRALRQCDGGRLQAIVMVRDDFSMAAVRFMDAIDIPILQGDNFAAVDLFDLKHSENVLTKFGQAFGQLPTQSQKISNQQRQFVNAVASGLAQDEKVVSVRLALFAEMVKGKSWEPATLAAVGGTEGIGVNFLEETFSGRAANPKHRLHQQAAREVLKTLLPEVDSDIKGYMRSHTELLDACGYQNRIGDFNALLRILDGELRLITPTDPEGFQTKSGSDPGSKFYQLTHDYLVPSLREWLTRKQKETRIGRAELELAERSVLWNAKPGNRHLPSLMEWANIRTLTEKNRWTGPQRKLMKRAGRFHGIRNAALLVLVAVLTFTGLKIRDRVIDANNDQRAAGFVTALVNADIDQVPGVITALQDYRQWADPKLSKELEKHGEDSNERLNISLALLPADPSQLSYLRDRLLNAEPEQVASIVALLEDHKDEMVDDLWQVAKEGDPEQLLQAASALAAYDTDSRISLREKTLFRGAKDDDQTSFREAKGDNKWATIADRVVDALVKENALRVALWIKTLRPARHHLVESLGVVYRDKSGDRSQTQIDLATDLLRDYAADDLNDLTELLLDGEPKQFAALFDEFAAHGDDALANLNQELDRELTYHWNDPPLDPAWIEPTAEVTRKITEAHGMIHEHFAFCQTMPLEEFTRIAELLRQSGYRPIRLRPYANDGSVHVAAAWTRDDRDWRLESDQSADAIEQRDEEQRSEGFVAVDIAGYVGESDGKPAELYAAVWVDSRFSLRENNAEIEKDTEIAERSATIIPPSRIYAGASYAEHKTVYGPLEKEGYKFQQSLQGFRGLDGHQKYCGVKTKSDSIGTWSWGLAETSLDAREYFDKIHWDVDPSNASDRQTTIERNEQALADAETKLTEKPDDLNARFARGTAYFYLGQNEESLAEMGHMIQFSPDFVTAYQFRAILYARLGDAAAARADLQNFADRNSSSTSKAYLDAVVSAYLDEETESMKRLETLVGENPEDDGTLYDAACAYSIASGVVQEDDATKSKLYADRAVTLLQQAIAAGYDNYSHMQEDADLDAIGESAGLLQIMKAGKLDRTYAAVWNVSTRFESLESHGLQPEEHLERCRAMQQDGYHLVSVSAASIDGKLVTASVWHRPLIPNETRGTFAGRRANAAAAMARLREHEKLFPVLRIADDPESLTQFVHRCRGQGVTTVELLECLKLADRNRQALRDDARRLEDRVLFGLLLALGEFPLDQLPSDQQQSTVDQVTLWYRDDPSSAIHGATGWLLRRWGQIDRVRQVDQTPRPYDPQHQWFTLIIESDQQRFYQTYVVIPPGDYDIGSPSDEPGHGSDELLNRVRLTRPVAILDREVTRGEFEASGVVDLNVADYRPNLEHPMSSPTWYDSVQFCRWLTKKAGFSESDQAYMDPSELDLSRYPRDGETGLPKNWPVKLDARGFRLPTEAEWEIAARAGMRTTYSFGADENLLDQYGWYRANSGSQTHIAKALRPNLRGLFDMHGNLLEWCHDWSNNYPLGSVRSDPGTSTSGSYRVYRGGSWFDAARVCRSGNRVWFRPTNRSSYLGFRVALVPLASDSE